MTWNVQCMICNKKSKFVDAKDVTQSHWTIIAWKVPSGEPTCICDKCEYGKPKEK